MEEKSNGTLPEIAFADSQILVERGADQEMAEQIAYARIAGDQNKARSLFERLPQSVREGTSQPPASAPQSLV